MRQLRIFLGFTALFLLPGLAVACSGDEETREDYTARVERELSKTDERIKELEEEAGTASGDAKDKIEDELSGLKDERDQVTDKLDDLRASQGDEWKTVKRELDEGLSKLDNRLDKALDDLKDSVTN